MPTINSIYEGSLRTKSIHHQSGNKLITDAPTDNQGKGEAFSPTDLLATSLGTCMLTTIGIAARKHGFNIDGTEISVTKIMASEPRRVKAIKIYFVMPKNNFTDEQKNIIEHTANNCPVALSIHPDLIQEVVFNY